jgi:hypothetical protein
MIIIWSARDVVGNVYEVQLHRDKYCSIGGWKYGKQREQRGEMKERDQDFHWMVWEVKKLDAVNSKPHLADEIFICNLDIPYFRFVVSGPLIHKFYILLDKMMPPKKEKTALDGIKRVIVDRLVFAPPFLLMFLYVITILEVSEVLHDISRKCVK